MSCNGAALGWECDPGSNIWKNVSLISRLKKLKYLKSIFSIILSALPSLSRLDKILNFEKPAFFFVKPCTCLKMRKVTVKVTWLEIGPWPAWGSSRRRARGTAWAGPRQGTPPPSSSGSALSAALEGKRGFQFWQYTNKWWHNLPIIYPVFFQSNPIFFIVT